MFSAAIAAMGMELLPPEAERLMTLATVRSPAGVNDAAVRTTLRETFNVEIGAGIGPLAGAIWRIGLMGAGATPASVQLLVSTLEAALTQAGHHFTPGAGSAAAQQHGR